MKDSITRVLDKLGLEKTGSYTNHFYVINLADSNEYSKMYTTLDEKAVNTEYPNFGTNKSSATTKITNYFEVEESGILYNIFLIADFISGKYYLKIGER